MVTDQQVKLYLLERKKGRRQDAAASRAAMSERTGRKYEQLGQMPSEARKEHSWRTRPDSFEEYWPWIKEQLDLNPGLEAKTLFEALQRQHPGKLQDGQLRTFQRRVRRWRAEEGPDKEIFFDQQYRPGEISESDFTSMNSLQVTVAGEAFPHLLYHFVLPYSNWETGSICFTESFESLSEGLQKGLWYLTGVPQFHQTDCLSAAVAKPRARKDEEAFTPRYDALMKHYRLTPKRTQPASPHENGDIEQRHHRFKRALDQRLMLRGSRNFTDRGAYEQFLQELFQELNAGRQQRFLEELETLQKLPERKLDCFKRVEARVGRGSIIIHWLVRKPGAFQNYRYREALFP
ncbi:MAG: IS21 family transposase, partial [Planctomycetota bacterium]|nr:IS21 family transposase [Planctomycetota bacterium]